MKLVEPCAGSAALTLFLMGAKRQVVPYQGSKWKLRRDIVGLLPPTEPLESIWLNDPGPWGPTWFMLYHHKDWVISVLQKYEEEDPKTVYDRLQGQTTPSTGSPAFAAQFLFLQRLSHSGKAVGLRGPRGGGYLQWNSPGFNKTSAYGTPATFHPDGSHKFGEVKPMIPSLIRVLEKADWKWPDKVRFTWMCASEMDIEEDSTVYFDPPYAGTTGYPGFHLGRQQVKDLSQKWLEQGATSIHISEAEPLGPMAVCLSDVRKDDGSPFKSKGAEWLTRFTEVQA